MADPRVSTDQTNAAFEGLSRRQAPGENARPAIDIYEPYGPPAPYTPASYTYRPSQTMTPGQMNAADFDANIEAWQRDIYPSQFGPDFQWKPGNDTVGPDGSKLPKGALGWDWAGNAYYGDGWGGAAKEWASKVAFGTDPYAGEVVAKKPAGGMSLPGMDPNRVRQDAGEVVDVWETVGNWWQKWVEGSDSPVGVVGRAVQETVGGGIQNLGAAAKGVKRLAGAAEGLANAGEGSILPDYRNAKWSDWINQTLTAPITINGVTRENTLTPEDMPGWDTLVDKIAAMTPPMLAYNALRTLTSPQDWDEKKRDINEGYQSAQIMYSTFIQPALQEEYIRRLRAGENPILLARELENPWAEMVGELILDPLNLIGAGPSKAARQAGRVERASAEFLQQYPEVETALKVWGNVAGEAAAGEKLNDVVSAQRKVSEAVAKGFDEFAADGKLLSYTPQAKAYQAGRRVGTVLQTIAANAANPEEALEYMRLLMQMHGSDDEIATAFASLRRFKLTGKAAMTSGVDIAPKMVLSRAGQETGLMLRRVMEDADGVVNVKKFLADLASKKTTKEMVEFAATKIGEANKDLIPDIGRRMEVLNHARSGKALTPLQARIANMGELTPGQAAYWKLTRKLDKVYKPVNSLLSGVYMGLSPGFAFRNLVTNSFHVLIDEGPSALLKRPAQALAETAEYLGGVTPEIGGYGVRAMGANVTEGGKTLPFQKLSEIFEEWGATQSYASGVRKTMEQMLQEGKAIPSTAQLVERGLSKADAQSLVSLTRKYKGNVGKAVSEMLSQMKTGSVDALGNMEWLSDADRTFLSDFGVLDRIQAAVDGRKAGRTQEEVLADVQKIYQELMDEAGRVADDVPTVSPEALGAEDINILVEQGVDENTVKLATHTTEANHQANAAYNTAVTQAFEEASMKYAGNVEMQGKLNTWFAKAQSWFSGDDYIAVKKAVDQRRQTTVLWRDRSFLDDFNVAEAWAQLGMKGAPPTGTDPKKVAAAFRQALWGEYFFPFQAEQLRTYRDIHITLGEKMFAELEKFSPGLNKNEILKARAQYNMAQQWDGVLRDDQVRQQLVAALNRGDNPGAARAYARQFGLDAPTDQHILNTVNKYAPPSDGEKYAHLAEVPPDVAKKAFVRRLSEKATQNLDAPKTLPDVADVPTIRPTPPYAGETPTQARALTEQREGLQKLFERVTGSVRENWDAQRFTYSNPDIVKAMQEWGKEGTARMAEARTIARKVGEAAKDFTMLSYPEKRNIDLALAYIYPYHFWYNRTYANWMKRLMYNPEIIAGYAKYREAMSEAHAGSPEWWKYNTAVTSLLGMDLENPLFFNLEATLNPLNGLTGVDFKDPYKRVNWFTAALDDMSRLGPSTWTPFNYAVALALKMQNEEEAASRWGGRLIPQTQVIKAALTSAGVSIPTWGQGINEFDPGVGVFSGGLDPYERRRVGRALGAMVDDGTITQAQALDAARTQEGDIWRTAIERAIKDRAGGQMASFLFGVGFKARKATDQQIDLMDQEWRMLWAQAPDMSGDEIRMRMDDLRNRYPFMDTVLLSRKAGLDRDRSYAYNVIGRIPPGQKNAIAELAGIDPRLIDKFYSDKGRMDKWSESDYKKFMAGMIDIGARFEMPDAATRQDWMNAQNEYSAMNARITAMFGADIQDKISVFFSMQTGEEKDAYLAQHPEVQAALSYKDATVVENPTLAPYYSSIDTIERYYRGVMYDLLRAEVGDMKPVWAGLDEAKLTGTEKAYRRAHPEIDRYYDLKAQYEKWVNEAIARAAKTLPEPAYSTMREDNSIDSIGEVDITGGMATAGQSVYDLTWDDVQGAMNPTLQRLVLDAVYNGTDLSYQAKKQLEYVAEDYGVDADMLLEILRNNVP